MSIFVIGNCINNLPDKFGNRQDALNILDGSKPVTAVVETIKELTETYEFEELKYQTPVPPQTPLNLTAGNPIIPISVLLDTIVGNVAFDFQGYNFWDITDVYDSWLWFAGGPSQAGRVLKYRRVPTIDIYSYGITSGFPGRLGVAPPVYFTRFNQDLQVGPVPDHNYQYFIRMKLRHPFPVPPRGLGAQFDPAHFATTISNGVITNVTAMNVGFGYPPGKEVSLDFSLNGTTNIPGVTQADVTTTINAQTETSTITIHSGGSGYPSPPMGGTAVLQGQRIFMPESWQEIIELCACQRLALWEGASEYVTYFESILRTKGIDVAAARARKAQMVRDEMHNERAMSLVNTPYTFAR